MTHGEITGKIKFDLREFENEQGFFDVPMKWPFNNGIPEDVVQKILTASDKIRAIDDAFSELLEEYFFSNDFSPTKEEIIVDKFLSVETSELIRVNNYNLRDFIANWVNFKVDDRVFRDEISKYESIKHHLEERIKMAQQNNQTQKDKTAEMRFYYKLSDVNEIKSRFLKEEGYKCLHKVRLYTEKEYMESDEKSKLRPVENPAVYSNIRDSFVDIADAYKALIKTVQNNYDISVIDFCK